MGRQRRGRAADELDLVPVMNLVTILIPFLLMSTHLVTATVVDVTAPAESDGEAIDDEVGLGLTVAITDAGYTVLGNADVLGEDGLDVPCEANGCPAGTYDTLGLTTKLGHVKHAHPDEDVVVLVPDPAVPYHVLIDTMDAVRADGRRELFPNVVVAGGTSE